MYLTFEPLHWHIPNNISTEKRRKGGNLCKILHVEYKDLYYFSRVTVIGVRDNGYTVKLQTIGFAYMDELFTHASKGNCFLK